MRATATRPPTPELAETFGLPECDRHLIAKLRNMDPALRATIMNEAEYRAGQERQA